MKASQCFVAACLLLTPVAFCSNMEVSMKSAKNQPVPKVITFLKDKEGVTCLRSGWCYKVLKNGTGKFHPGKDSQCKCHYVGTTPALTPDATEKDESAWVAFGEGEILLSPNQVIKGLGEAMQLMVEGDDWEIYIPPELGFGMGAYGGEVLIYRLELHSFSKPLGVPPPPPPRGRPPAPPNTKAAFPKTWTDAFAQGYTFIFGNMAMPSARDVVNLASSALHASSSVSSSRPSETADYQIEYGLPAWKDVLYPLLLIPLMALISVSLLWLACGSCHSTLRSCIQTPSKVLRLVYTQAYRGVSFQRRAQPALVPAPKAQPRALAAPPVRPALVAPPQVPPAAKVPPAVPPAPSARRAPITPRRLNFTRTRPSSPWAWFQTPGPTPKAPPGVQEFRMQ